YVLEFGDAEALGRIAEHRSDFFGRPRAANPSAAGCLHRRRKCRVIRWNRAAVDDFAFRDQIRFRLGLGVKALNGCTTKSGTCNHLQYECVPSFHHDPLNCAPNTSVRGVLEIMLRSREASNRKS